MSGVGIATSYGLDGPGIEARWRLTQPPINGYRVSPGVKRPVCGVDHPPPIAPRLKKEWMYNYSFFDLGANPPPHPALATCARVNFTFTIPFTIRFGKEYRT